MKVSEVGFVFSEHYKRDDLGREAAIRSIGGDGTNVIAKFYWDKGHAAGAEWHWVTDNAVIIVTNVNKMNGKLVCTKLIARPQQLLRYRQMGIPNELDENTKRMRNWIMPQRIVGLARQHQLKGLNLS